MDDDILCGAEIEAVIPGRTVRDCEESAGATRIKRLRDSLGIVRSADRSLEHNRAVGGETPSEHLDGAAFDIAMANHDPVAFEKAACEAGFLGFGFYPRSGFTVVRALPDPADRVCSRDAARARWPTAAP